jgi:DNA-binding transcriptional MerR regulator/effector-binding domain-containing protein
MLKIGDFSRLSRVTVKTLRFYDDMGLLKPVQIDRYTGYRYYSVDQLPRLSRILAYKDLGFSLEQIRGLLDENPPLSQLHSLLLLKQSEVQARLEDDQRRLRRLEVRLKQIEFAGGSPYVNGGSQEAWMSTYEVVIKKVEPLQVASVRDVVPSYDESEPYFDRMFDELYGYVHRQGAHRVGCGIAVYHTTEGQENAIEVEAIAPIYEPLRASQRVQVYGLAGVEQMACVVHHGPFATIGQAYQAVVSWIEANDYHITGPCREIYLRYERGGDQKNYVTEVQFPVSKA